MGEVKRLLCIISGMNRGGAETFLMKMFRKLDRSKYQMDFCVNLRENGQYDEEIKRLGGKKYIIPSKSENFDAFRKGLSEIIENNHYKYVMRVTSNDMGFYDLKIAKKNGAIRCIARSSNSSDEESWKVKVAHLIGRILYSKYVDVKIAPSDLAAKYTFGKKAYKNGRVHILHNALDTKEYTFNLKKRELIRNELAITDDTLVIGHIGRFSEQKNHKFLLEIFEEIYNKNRNSRLVLIGDGKLKTSIEQRAYKMGLSKAVFFTGIREDIPDLLSAMDVFVFPSLYEGMPNTVIEAQACALPCLISSNITKEANITGLVHYCALKNTSEKWAEKALKLVKKPTERLSEAQTIVSSFITNNYEIETVVQQFENLVFER